MRSSNPIAASLRSAKRFAKARVAASGALLISAAERCAIRARSVAVATRPYGSESRRARKGRRPEDEISLPRRCRNHRRCDSRMLTRCTIPAIAASPQRIKNKLLRRLDAIIYRTNNAHPVRAEYICLSLEFASRIYGHCVLMHSTLVLSINGGGRVQE